MKAHVFRDLRYAPSAVTAICSNNSTIVAFRRNKTVEFIDSTTLKHFIRYDLGLAITESCFLDANTVVCLSDSGQVLLLDIATLEKEVLDLSASHISVLFVDAVFAERAFLYTTTKNELFEMRAGKPVLLLREKAPITALLHAETCILFATQDGWIRAIKRDGRTVEIEAGACANALCRIGNDRFVAGLASGAAVLIDTENGVVLDTVAVRKHALNAVVYSDGYVHISGVDSRIVCYSVAEDKLVRSTQADYHAAEVLAMALDGDRVLSAGEDTVLVVNTFFNGRYTARRVYENSIHYGCTNNHFYVAGDASLDMFRLCGAVEEGHSASVGQDECNSRITFKVSPGVLEKIGQKQTCFSHFLRFNISAPLLALAVSRDEKYLAYSTSQETLFYSLFRGSKLGIEKIRAFGPASQIVFTDNALIVLEHSKQVVVFSLDTFKIAAEIPFEDFRERISVHASTLVLSQMKRVVDLAADCEESLVAFDDAIAEIVSCADGFRLLACDADGGLRLCALQDGNAKSIFSLKDQRGLVSIASDSVLYDDRHVFIVDDAELKRYEFDSIVHGVIEFAGDLIVLQTSWVYLKTKFKPSVFKEKFSN